MKLKKLTAATALLLATSTLLASCNDPGKGGGNGSSDWPYQTTVENNYAEPAKAWAEYLSYLAPEEVKSATAALLFDNVEPGSLNVKYDRIVELVTEEMVYVEVTPEEEPPLPGAEGDGMTGDGSGEEPEPAEPVQVLTKTVKTVKWYDLYTGKEIKSFVSVTPATNNDEGVEKVHDSVDLATVEHFDISYNSELIIVKRETKVLKTPEAPAEGEEPVVLDPKATSSYEDAYEYSVYFTDGTPFLTGLEENVMVREVENSSAEAAGRFLVDCKEKGKTYLVEDNKAVKEFNYGEEYNVPVYDKDSLNVNGTGYAYFEKGDKKYIIREATPQMMPIGNLYLTLVPGIEIEVLDKNDAYVAAYESSCYGIVGYAVLSNGNIYVCEYELLNADAATYDFAAGTEKFNVKHNLISVTDGSVKELDISFAPSKLLNNTTKEIKTFINLTTLEVTNPNDLSSALLNGVVVKDGYILAEIQKYAEGVIDTTSVYAVLDESFNIVKELPKIIADQFTYPAFLDSDIMVVSSRTVGNKNVYYSLDLVTGEMSILPALSQLVNVEILDNGYLWNNTLYDPNWRAIHKLEDCEGIRVVNGKVYCHCSGEVREYRIYRSSNTYYDGAKDEWVDAYSYNYDYRTVYYGATIVDDNLMVYVDGYGYENYYNLVDASYLVGTNQPPYETIDGKDYSVFEMVSSCVDYEDLKLITVVKNYRSVSGDDEFTLYKYYIVK